MPDILYHDAIIRLQTDKTMIVEYHFTIGVLPIIVKLAVHRANNNATFDQLLHEAAWYTQLHYLMLQERSN